MNYDNSGRNLNNYNNYDYDDDIAIGDNRLPQQQQQNRIIGVDKQGKDIIYNNRNDLEYIHDDNDLDDVKDEIDLESVRSETNKLTNLAGLVPSTSSSYYSSDEGEEGDYDDDDYTTDDSANTINDNNYDRSNISSCPTSATSINLDHDPREREVQEQRNERNVDSSPSSPTTSSTNTNTNTKRRFSLNLNLDEEIINKVLRKSKQRSKRLRQSESLKKLFPSKCWKRVLVSMFVIFGAAAIVLGTLFFYMNATPDDFFDHIGVTESDGTLFLYDDHADFHKHEDYDYDLHHILDEPIIIAVGTFPEHLKSKVKNIDERPVKDDTVSENIGSVMSSSSQREIPFFWKVPNSGDVMEAIMTECFGFAIASDVIGDKLPITQSKPDELFIYNVDDAKYVNVDLSERAGIEAAAELGLVQSGVADIISSKQLNLANDLLFDGYNDKSYLFTMLRHPVDQTIMSYYKFINNPDRESDLLQMTLQEYIESPYMDSNILTHFLSNVSNLKDPVDREHLNLAKEILRRKGLVGVYEVFDESVELFTAYFGWNETIALNDECVSNHITDSLKRTRTIHKKFIHQNYNIKYGSEIYNAIVLKNEYDMDLYWYAYDLHKARQLWIE